MHRAQAPQGHCRVERKERPVTLLPTEDPPKARDLPLQQRFDLWVREHPEVVDALGRQALAAVAAGATRLSMKSLFELARYSAHHTVRGSERWRLDNSFTAPLARLLMAKHPRLRGVFEVRGHR